MQKIDFTDMPRRRKSYSGSNGKKLSVVYNDATYMIKFPLHTKTENACVNLNGCIQEYIGSHIFEMTGIPAHETLLGTYQVAGEKRVVVACKDFVSNPWVLQDFASLKNSTVGLPYSGNNMELSEVVTAIHSQKAVDPKELIDFFWDMFVVDALIGNDHRHNGNWGFLYNVVTDEIKIAPVYDCGSCLYPQADNSIMEKCLRSVIDEEYWTYEMPLSAFRANGKNINYFDYISSLKCSDCNEALKRIAPRINMARINVLIDDTPYISDLQKVFYKKMIASRKEKIIDYSFEKLINLEKNEDRSSIER